MVLKIVTGSYTVTKLRFISLLDWHAVYAFCQSSLSSPRMRYVEFVQIILKPCHSHKMLVLARICKGVPVGFAKGSQ